MGEERGLGREVRVFLYCKLGMEGGSRLAGLDACVCVLYGIVGRRRGDVLLRFLSNLSGFLFLFVTGFGHLCLSGYDGDTNTNTVLAFSGTRIR
ncbi:hypothetical protein HOY82DRAFT_354322 [Tuber indicum]|nr:hypothetical protein HOY82DRAFT_354322 [Tuber indicum]